MKTVLFLGNSDIVIYNFRMEIVQRLCSEGHRVVVCTPYGDRIKLLEKIGCEYIPVKIARHGKNPFKDLLLMTFYKKIIRSVKPDMIFSYTIKPNLYAAFAARKCNVPIVINITGLGIALETKGILQRFLIFCTRGLFDLFRQYLCKIQRTDSFL